ncbi:hypothetical protein Clacol_004114 [Clathrus columnatus]|uniref:Exocyst complex component Sec3 PIP2-binding N-terminal domain-containing protein n=1 Tax=Clathrus columnatus TaxID=1419009 RepID=A0AAV5AAF4_9AGAM|nr:hypothetical protein Clacol_004114 [Clathrus columnatus]
MDIKAKIIASVFTKRSPPETYICHVKIWEDTEDGTRKPRYLLLSRNSTDDGFIHKSKMNTNGTFSIGKTWRLIELRAVEVTDVTQSRTSFDQSRSTTPRISIEQPRVTTPSRNLGIGRNSPKFVPQLPITPNRPTSPPVRPQFTRPDSVTSSVISTPTSIYPRSPAPIAPIGEIQIPKFPRSPSRPPSRPSTATDRTSQPIFELGRSSRGSERQLEPGDNRAKRTPSPSLPPSAPRTPSPHPPLHLPCGRNSAEHPKPPLENRPSVPQLQPAIPLNPKPETATAQQPTPTQEAPKEAPIVRKETNGRDYNARISFFDTVNQSNLDRLLHPDSSIGIDEDSSEVIMANVEEMLEGYEWVNDTTTLSGTKRKRTAADQIEARLQDELVALEKATIYAFLEEDDLVGLVLKYIGDALRELDSMDIMVSSYKIHLNAVSEDISYIQSQNRGLQVQTQNQKNLLEELEKLLETANVDPTTLLILTQESLEKQSGIDKLERAAADLYKALLSGRDSEMAMAMAVERSGEYKTYNNQFCKRLHDYFEIMFGVQSDRTLNNKGCSPNELRRHKELEEYLGRYCGLMLYLKEMSDDWYSNVRSASALHNQEIKAYLLFYASLVKKATDEEQEMSWYLRDFFCELVGDGIITGFSPPVTRGANQLRRVKSVRTPLDSRTRDRDKRTGERTELRSPEALDIILKQIGTQIQFEEQFIADFLHINNVTLTYADYMSLESFFRRQATRNKSLSSSTAKLIRGAMDLIFGSLAGEIKSWIDIALTKDNVQVIGMLATLEAAIKDSEERGNAFWAKVLQRQQQRLKGLYDRHIDEQVRAIEQTKLTTKKRKGVAQFIKYFPTYASRIENQLKGYDSSETRELADAAYEKIIQSMFEALKQMAKLEGDGDAEDKDQLNYHVELVDMHAENMRYFITEMTEQQLGNFRRFIQLAQSNYDENLSAYIKIILRRPFARILDYFDGVERLLQSTSPADVADKPNYNKGALKRVIKEYNAKDIRRHVDALYKRVEKHYTDEDFPTNSAILLKAVWMACEQELVKSTERFNRITAQCYKDANVSLEYTTQDVEALMASMITEGFVNFKVKNVDKHCQTWYKIVGDLKSSKRPLIVLHGGPGLPHHYLLSLADLNFKHGIPVIFYDQIGTGNSTRFPEKLGDEEFWVDTLFVDELENLIKHLGVETSFDLYGHSWGAIIAAILAGTRSSPGLHHVVLADAPATDQGWVDGATKLRKSLPQEVQETLSKHENAGTTEHKEYQEAMEVYVKRHICKIQPYPEELRTAFKVGFEDRTSALTIIGPSEWETIGNHKKWSGIPFLHKITASTLIINGRDDPAQDEAVLPYFLYIPKCRWVTFENSSHMPHIEEQEKLIYIVANFLGAE